MHECRHTANAPVIVIDTQTHFEEVLWHHAVVLEVTRDTCVELGCFGRTRHVGPARAIGVHFAITIFPLSITIPFVDQI